MICKKRTRLLVVLLAVITAISLLPTAAFAAEGAPTRTQLLDLSKLTETTDMLDAEGWKWEPNEAGGILTLRDCYIQTASASLLKFPTGSSVEIVLEGDNILETTSTTFGAMIYDASASNSWNLVIREGAAGGGLRILRADTSKTESNPYGIGGNSITIQSGDIYANTDFCIIKSDFTMTGGSLTIDIANATDGNGIYTDEGNISISGGTVDIQAGQVGMYIPGISGDGEQTISITGGDVAVKSGLAGLYAKNIRIQSTGSVDIQGETAALYCSQDGGSLEILKAKSLTLSGKYAYLPEDSTETKTVVVGEADYSAVDAAIASIPEDLSSYTDASVTTLNTALESVIRGKSVLEQDIVEGYAQAISEAVAALEKKPAGKPGGAPAPSTPDTDGTEAPSSGTGADANADTGGKGNPDTGAAGTVQQWMAVLTLSAAALIAASRRFQGKK